MWKMNREEPKPAVQPTPQPARQVAASAVMPPKEVRPVETPKPIDSFRADVAHIGKSVIFKGELSGSEDVYLDGEIEGTVELTGHSLTIGPNGRVRATLHARDVIVHGKVDGDIHGSERVELKKSAILVGDIFTQRIVIEDGAYFKGGIDIQKVEPAKPTPAKPEPKATAPSVAASAVAAPSHAPLLEHK